MSLNRYDMKFILLLSSPDNLSISETLPFLIIQNHNHYAARTYYFIWKLLIPCFHWNMVRKNKICDKDIYIYIFFNTDEIKINLDEILPEWNTHLRQVVRGTNTFNGLVMMPNSLAVSITIYVYAHTNVRR